MDDFIKYAEDRGASYTELTSTTSARASVEVSNRNVKELSSGLNRGFGVRLIYKERQGCAFSNDASYRELIDSAIKNASLCRGNSVIDLQKPVKRSFITKCKINPEDVSLEEKRDLLLGINAGDFRKVENLSISYTDIKKDITFLNSEGRDLRWGDTITYLTSSAYARDNNRFESFYNVMAEHMGFELTEKTDSFCEEVMRIATEMLAARDAKKGMYPAIVDQRLGGVLAHEAIGHACEADIVLDKSSVLHDKIGQKIAPGHVNIYDSGAVEGAWGWAPFDSEGILGGKTALIDKGVVSGFLHNRVTAHKMQSEPTGNGRAHSLGNKIIPRMTNTYIENGDSSFEEMVSSIKGGYYLKRSAGGQVDPATGEFLFNALESFWIENGEIAQRVKGVSMVGNILTTLNQISLLGKDLLIEGGGACGKAGQYVLTGDGSPHLKVDTVRIGGTD